MKTKTTLKKPTLTTKDVLAFAESPQGDKTVKVGIRLGRGKKNPPGSPEKRSGNIPAGDIRLSSNIDRGIHLRLKIAAAKERTTIGEVIERLVEENLD